GHGGRRGRALAALGRYWTEPARKAVGGLMNGPGASRPALVWALAFLALAASGCADVTDVNRRILVYAIGLDRGEDEQVQLTIQYLLTSGGQQSGGGDGGSPPLQTAPVNHTVSAPTVALALDQIIHQIPGELFLGNLRI